MPEPGQFLEGGARLRTLRQSRKVSLRALAGRIYVNPSTLSRIESGYVIPPNEVIRDYLKALNYDDEDATILGDEVRLLFGRAPLGVTSEEAALIAGFIRLIRQKLVKS